VLHLTPSHRMDMGEASGLPGVTLAEIIHLILYFRISIKQAHVLFRRSLDNKLIY
jgi:hypothetical protein